MLHILKKGTRQTKGPANEFERIRTALTATEILEAFGHSPDRTGKLCCPQHPDSNPSCLVDDYHVHCFGGDCGWHTDTVGIVQDLAHLSFDEALDWIADKANIEPIHRTEEQLEYLRCIDAFGRIYRRVIDDSQNDPRPAEEYLVKRGISLRTCESVGVGFLPPDYDRPDYERFEQCGLLNVAGNFTMRNRLVIPVWDQGRIVSIYSRAIDENTKPPHLFPHKSDPPAPETLWNLNRCSPKKLLYVTEGIIDALTLIDRGITNVAAAFGTQGLRKARRKLLVDRGYRQICLVFDSDENEAGYRGAISAARDLFIDGIEAEITTLPLSGAKTDVNSWFLAGHTIEEFMMLGRVRSFPAIVRDIRERQTTTAEKIEELKPLLVSLKRREPLERKGYLDDIRLVFPKFGHKELAAMISEKPEKEPKERGPSHLEMAQTLVDSGPKMFMGRDWWTWKDGCYRQVDALEVEREAAALVGPTCTANIAQSIRRLASGIALKTLEDCNPTGLLCVKNGILDPETRELRPAVPTDYFTRQSSSEFNPDAECHHWIETLTEIFPDNDGEMQLLQKIFGYCLTSDISYQKAFIFYGAGANGKSVVTDVLKALIGNGTFSSMGLEQLGERFAVSALLGKGVNFSAELPSRMVLEDGPFKALVSGEAIQYERKGQDAFCGVATCKFIASTNNMPATSDRSEGLMRRLIFLCFGTRIPPARQDRHRAANIIERELPGVLNWALDGLDALKENGFTDLPIRSMLMHEDFGRANNHVLQFSDEELEIGAIDGTTHSLKSIHSVYLDWCEEVGQRYVLQRNTFYRALSESLAIRVTKSKTQGAFLPGVSLSARSMSGTLIDVARRNSGSRRGE